jgi:hypothetical protein
MDFNFGQGVWCFGMLIYEANNLTCDVSKKKLAPSKSCDVIQDYQKVSVHLTIAIVTSNVESVPRQSPDTRLALTPSVIPNSYYVIMVGDWKCLKYCIFARVFVLKSAGAQRLFDHTVELPSYQMTAVFNINAVDTWNQQLWLHETQKKGY